MHVYAKIKSHVFPADMYDIYAITSDLGVM